LKRPGAVTRITAWSERKFVKKMKTKKLLFPFIFLSLVFLDRDFSTGYGRFNYKNPPSD